MELTPVDAKNSDSKIITLTTNSSKRKEKPRNEYIPEDPYSDSSLSDSSSSKSDFSDDRKFKNKIYDKKKKHRTFRKQDLSDSLSSDSDLFNKSDYKLKMRNKKKDNRKNKRDPIKLCAKLTAKLLTAVY